MFSVQCLPALLVLAAATTGLASENWPLIYNQGVTAYRSNDFAAAAAAFEQATASTDRPLQARSFYNLGNAYYRLGQVLEQEGPQAALPAFQKSLQHYENALAIAPADEDAQFNRELVKKKIEELKQQQEQQQQQPRQQKEDEKQDQPKPEQQPEQGQPEKPDQAQQKPEQQPEPAQPQPQPQPEQQPGGQSPTNRLDKVQARVLLDNLREDERNWNFFPELQQRAGEEKQPEKDW